MTTRHVMVLVAAAVLTSCQSGSGPLVSFSLGYEGVEFKTTFYRKPDPAAVLQAAEKAANQIQPSSK